ncbi:MAG: hypothetical protein J6568_03420 [Snodgrassella sp.]|nr:hypothetical protein [Snodgrassella sp.]
MELINKLVDVFPTRPLKVMKLKQEGRLHQTRRIFAVIICLVLALYIALKAYPGLVDDYKISRNPVVVDNHIEGKCRVKYMFNYCSVKITTDDGDVIERNYTFIGGKRGNYHVVAVASADDPSLVTIDLAINNMLTQFVVITALILLLMWAIWMNLVYFLRTRKSIKVLDEMNGQRLKPVIVPIKLKSYGPITTVLYHANNIQGIDDKYVAHFHDKSGGGPIIIGELIKDKGNALAVIGQNGSVPIILDQDLTRCDFTDNEIQALKEVLS